MPEATILCIDSSDYMRNGDYFPSRLSGAQEASSLVLGFKMQSNPENTIGFLTMGGKACTVRETLTTDADRVMASTTTIPIGGRLHFSHGLQIAQLALSHRLERRHEARIIAFVGSPITEPAKDLEKLAKRLRKDDIAVDIVAFGVPENLPLLDSFISTVNKNDNSHFINVAVGNSIVDSAVPVLTGGAAGGGAGGAAGGQDLSEFGGVDPNVDPDLAMVLRMSIEDERRRIEAAAEAERQQAGGTAPAAAPAGGSADEPATAAPAATSSTGTSSAAPAATSAGAGGADRVLTEEEEFELALKLSMQPAGGDPDVPKAAEAPAETAPEFKEAVNDPEFLRQLQEDAAKEDDDEVNDATKKE